MQIRQYIPVTSSLLGIYDPVYPSETTTAIMPSTTTSILTSAVTLTSFVTVTTGQFVGSSTPVAPSSISSVSPSASPSANPYPNLPPALVSAIEGLNDCTVSVLNASPPFPVSPSHLILFEQVLGTASTDMRMNKKTANHPLHQSRKLALQPRRLFLHLHSTPQRGPDEPDLGDLYTGCYDGVYGLSG